jgi:winged helix DNA-binding protein
VPEVLTKRDLNRALLARQLLLERQQLSADEAIARVAGLQAQAAVPPFVGLWTRLAGFEPAELQVLIDERRIVRATLMRHTIHFVPAEDYLWLRPTIQPALDANFSAQTRKRLAGTDIEPFLAAARKEFSKRPLTFSQVKELIRAYDGETDVDAIAYAVRTKIPLIGVPNGSRWRFGGRAPFVLGEDWLGRKLRKPDPREMVRHYLAAFGPATPGDATAWSGVGGMRQVFESMKAELRTFRDEAGRELFDVPDGLLPGGDIEVPVRFLPEYDNTLLGHRDRSRVVADDHRSRIYIGAGLMNGTVLVDGFAAATWRMRDGELALDPFRKLKKAEQKAINAEADALHEWVKG